jgi:hypothetical protein
MDLVRQLARRVGRPGLIVAAGAVLAISTCAVALADSTTVTMNVNGGSLAESVYATPVSTPVTLNGTDQTTSYTFSVDANDPTGTGNGWKVQVTSTTFSTGGGAHALSTGASSVTSASASCKQGTCTSPTTSSLSYPVAVPAAATPPAAVTFFNAATNTGMGEFVVSPSVQVNIPANTYAGTYSSTLTLSIVSGP